MTRRMIDSAMWSNENFAALPVMARLLQVGIINMADDQGRVKAFPAYLRSQIFPYDDVSIVDIAKWLQLIAKNGTIAIYQAGGKEYIQLLNWWDYQSLQFASPSQYPAPDGWQDHIRYNAKGLRILTHCWITIDGTSPDDTCDERGDPLPIVATLPPVNRGGRPRRNLDVNSPGNLPENSPEFPPGNLDGNTNKDQSNINQDQIQELDEEEDARVRDPANEAWQDSYGEEIPGNLRIRIGNLVKECGPDAVVHAIQASKNADARNFRYIAQCARNYLPPAPPGKFASNGYHVEVDFMPGVHALTPAATAQPPPLPPPMPHDDPWAIVMAELLPTLSSQAAKWLQGSELLGPGELAGVPLYQVTASDAANLDWLKQQVEPAIRKKLSSLLGKRILVEFVAARVPTVHGAEVAA